MSSLEWKEDERKYGMTGKGNREENGVESGN